MKRYYNAPQSVKLQVAVSLLFNLFFVYYIPYHQQGLGLVLAHTIPSSIWVVLSIMVNHEVDIHDHKSHDQEQGKNPDWGMFQIIHSHDFGADSLLTCYLTGGLNLQVEHHLFPTIFFPRLFQIRHVVKEYCIKKRIEIQ